MFQVMKGTLDPKWMEVFALEASMSLKYEPRKPRVE